MGSGGKKVLKRSSDQFWTYLFLIQSVKVISNFNTLQSLQIRHRRAQAEYNPTPLKVVKRGAFSTFHPPSPSETV